MAVHRGCLTPHAGPEQCWWHGPVRRVVSGAARRGQQGARVVESVI